MKNFIITSAVCIAMILSSESSMAQQITIVSGKVLNLPEGEKSRAPSPWERPCVFLLSIPWPRHAMP